MRSRIVLVLAVLVAASLHATGEDSSVKNTSFVAPDEKRVLQHETVFEASAREVWDAFATSEGFASWAVPVAKVDLRIGGDIESSYDPNAKIGAPGNIKNRILAYVPLRMLAFQIAQTPPGFPHADAAKKTWTVIEIRELGPKRVHVTCSMVGYEKGADFDTLSKFFDHGNAYTLAKLRERFEKGPTDWKKVFAKPAK